MKSDFKNNFYVYIYFDPDKKGEFIYGQYTFEFEPFYVGKGHKLNRKFSHLKTALKSKKNSFKYNKIRKLHKQGLNPIIVVFRENLTEIDAFKLECDLIKNIGRFDLHLGPLTNLTDGGEGLIGRIVKNETKEKISKAVKKRMGTPEAKKIISDANKKRFTDTYCEEISLKVSKSMKQKWKDPVYLKKMNKRPGHNLMSEGIKKKWCEEEYRNKIITAITGKKRSIKSKQLISNAMKGREITWKDQISETLKGRKMSLETRRKMSQSQKLRRQKMKDEANK